LDESTSALDTESELVVQDALDNIVRRKKLTTIIVAHRLTTIRNADSINVVVGGSIVESGTHDELMSKQGFYRELIEKQGLLEDDITSLAGRPSEYNRAPLKKSITQARHDLSDTPNHIEFKDVVFAYPTRPSKKVLDCFNLVIRQGEAVALVGPSGQGTFLVTTENVLIWEK
jgi:ABC-type multidrug transport system fused ATPase/permease subunit